ncbi:MULTISPECIES: hypothetical protein [Xanthomonas]|uniref:hypothetical protein n=1 Tax=Xanthomonas TaxID=338 RepID=UPI00114C9B90|nr:MULTISPECIES: hypothetical protein [Xanthomonas]MEB1153100.1 hypothetical protein [Xanthomonas campestris pv. campestris]MCC5099088.1 hypothetical protein [Xanthomonas campestris]MEA9585333.1 hypothetical protein [Xanthomonas campestris]MEA9593684.1 hypothetical protein [Xanthomonas campestris]MEA9625226.1 hypothetical protein [Xanthomonas campestris]
MGTNAGENANRDEVDPEYRQWLVVAEQKAQEDYDKTVLTLSGGALGISFAFVKDIVGQNPIQNSSWLVAAWILWALSTSAMLGSFFVSRLALRRAILQCDDGTIFCNPPGGFYTQLTRWLNGSGAVLFLFGICFMAAFVKTNLTERENPNGRQKITQPTTKQSTTPAPPSSQR